MVTKLKSVKTPVNEAITKEHSSFETMLNSFCGTENVSWKRNLVGLAAGFFASLGIGYCVGVLTETMMLGAMTLTSSLFVGLMIWVIGLALSMYLGMLVGTTVHNSIACKTLDAGYYATKSAVSGTMNTIRSWFVAEPVAS